MGLRGCSVVELEHAAEALSALDWAFSDQRGLGRDEFITQTLVRPFLMVMVDKRLDGCPGTNRRLAKNARFQLSRLLDVA